MDELIVLYFQPTLGHAHRARVRMLDSQPGIRCIGVQYADRELTRAPEGQDATPMHTLARGVYEHLPWTQRATSAVRFAKASGAHAAILDSPADSAQFATGWWLQRLGIKTFVRWASTREDYPRRAWRERLKRPVYRRWDGYLATGARAAQYAASFGVTQDRIFICGNPVDVLPFASAASARSGEREACFLFVGRFIWHKNLEGLLNAYDSYRKRGGTFRLEIAGEGSGESADRVRARAATTPGVRMLGFLGARELAEAYARASCLVLPSLSENWGLVVNEAMHAGLAVIVSERCGCVTELVRDGENGFIVDPERPESIAAALERTEALGGERRAAMGARARILVASQTPELWAERCAAALRQICTFSPYSAIEG